MNFLLLLKFFNTFSVKMKDLSQGINLHQFYQKDLVYFFIDFSIFSILIHSSLATSV